MKKTARKTTKQKAEEDEEQSRLFIEKARELGADAESGGDELMKRLAKTPPEKKDTTK